MTRSTGLPRSEFILGDLLWRDDAQVAATPKQDEDVTITSEGGLPNQAFPLKEARDELVRGVAAAATRGILTANSREVGQTKTDHEEVIDLEPNTDPHQQVDLRQPVSNIRISNSGELQGDELNLLTSINEFSKCSPEMDLNISEWKPKGTFEHEVSSLQAELYDATDKLKPKVALDLTRLYLYYGFGPEASRVLALSLELQQAHPELVDISSIMEFGYARNPRIVHKLSECDGASHFWALLSADEVPENSGIKTDLVLSSLTNLPLHLRRYFVPIVSDRLLTKGDVEGSLAAIRMLDRTTINDFDELTLAQVNIKLITEEDVDSSELNEIISESSPVAPQALVSYVDTKIQKNESVSQEVVELLESYVFEFQDSEDHADLNVAYIAALSKSGQFEESFRNFRSIRDDVNIPLKYGLLRNLIIDELVSNASDIQFVSLFFKFSEIFEQLDDLSVTTAVVERLLRLGFKEQANSFVESISGEYENDHKRLLKAKIAVINGSTDEALELISDLSSNEASFLRSSIYETQGAYNLLQSKDQNTSQQLSVKRNAGPPSSIADTAQVTNEEFSTLYNIAREEVPEVQRSSDFLEQLEALVLSVGSARQVLLDSISSVQKTN
jgi:hypothetical protein